MPIHTFASVHVNSIFHASANHGHMMSARRKQGVAGKDVVTVLRLLDANLAEGVETISELVRKRFWHVLHDNDSRKVGRQRREEIFQGFSSTG